jgi:hypothetical protein
MAVGSVAAVGAVAAVPPPAMQQQAQAGSGLFMPQGVFVV